MKRAVLWLLALVLCGCSASGQPTQTTQTTTQPTVQPTTLPAPTTEPKTTEPPDPVEELLDSMTLEEKVGQLFLARCPGAEAAALAQQYHLGGYILFGADFEGQTPGSIQNTISGWQSAAAIPLLIAVDEEGGTVCRVSANPAFRAEPFPSPRSLYDRGGLELVGSLESEKAYLLHYLGINVNMGPVCDVATQPGSFMYRRSLGQSPEVTGEFAADAVQRMAQYQVGSVLKHFPGYGSNGDTHTGIIKDNRSLETLEGADLIPFAAGIRAGCGAILMSHNIVTALDAELPASLSPAVHGYLRYTMGFDGVIVTDDLVMGAIVQRYGVGEAAVLAVRAGNDLLCSTEFAAQYDAVLEAVQAGELSEELLNNAVRRVLRWKQALGML